MENTAKDAGTAGAFIGYGETVKGAIFNALAAGTSVLQKDRQGVDYSLNAASGTVYSGINQLYLQQVRANNNFANPHFMTFEQARNKGMFVKKSEKGAIINYYSNPMRHHRTEYPLGADGLPDKSQKPIHEKGDVKKDAKGHAISGNEYNFAFNLEQINPELHNFRKNSRVNEEGKRVGGYEYASSAVVFNNNVKLENPFPETAKPGLHYKAKDASIIEKFGEDVSKYFNSLYTGEKFTAVKYTPEEIKTLQAEITNKQSPVFEKINTGSLLAAGNTAKIERIEKARESKAERQKAQIRSM